MIFWAKSKTGGKYHAFDVGEDIQRLFGCHNWSVCRRAVVDIYVNHLTFPVITEDMECANCKRIMERAKK